MYGVDKFNASYDIPVMGDLHLLNHIKNTSEFRAEQIQKCHYPFDPSEFNSSVLHSERLLTPKDS